MKKQYYIPGSISIILLPLLGYYYFQSHNYFTQLSAIPFHAVDFDEIRKKGKESDLKVFN